MASASDTQSPIDASLTATIANGASLSGAVALGGFVPVGIVYPAAWTAAAISFEGSYDNGTTYVEVCNSDGTEYTIASANVQTADSRYVPLTYASFLGLTHLKVRSGVSGTPVNQLAARTIIPVLRRM